MASPLWDSQRNPAEKLSGNKVLWRVNKANSYFSSKLLTRKSRLVCLPSVRLFVPGFSTRLGISISDFICSSVSISEAMRIGQNKECRHYGRQRFSMKWIAFSRLDAFLQSKSPNSVRLGWLKAVRAPSLRVGSLLAEPCESNLRKRSSLQANHSGYG